MPSPLFIAIAAIAVFAAGLSKSNFAVSLGAIAVPLLATVMPARDAAGMMLPILCVMDLVAILVYRREVDWRVYWIMIPGAAIGTLVGWALSARVSEAAVGLAVGLISLIFVLDAWLPLRKKLAGIPPSRPWGVLWGAVAGFTSFISHTGGPPYQIYTVPLRLKPVVFAGTTAVFFATVNYAKLVPFYFLGQLSVANLELSAALLPVGLFGMLAGVWLVRRVDSKFFYQLAYVLIFFLALDLIYEGVRGIWFTGA
ncbi:MAG: sulfite exporter TauE/SafE family protein [Devosia sp.]|nr:sulfite exporter TauE/SafE family protein [Devosia sp.]